MEGGVNTAGAGVAWRQNGSGTRAGRGFVLAAQSGWPRLKDSTPGPAGPPAPRE